MKAFDPALASPFRLEWLVPMDATTEDDYTRAIAEKALPILRSARFMSAQQAGEPVDMEVRVWVQAACASACVSITWEPGLQSFGFHLLDESLRERLAVIVFHELPCVDADASAQQQDDVLRAALRALKEAEGRAPSELAHAVREAEKSIRIPVLEGPADSGIDP